MLGASTQRGKRKCFQKDQTAARAGLPVAGTAGRKLNVSRQAVTKWETGGGVPDIENLRALSALFCISLDELLENRAVPRPLQDFLFESVTEYDVDCQKDFDISFSGACRVVLCGCGGERSGCAWPRTSCPESRALSR